MLHLAVTPAEIKNAQILQHLLHDRLVDEFDPVLLPRRPVRQAWKYPGQHCHGRTVAFRKLAEADLHIASE